LLSAETTQDCVGVLIHAVAASLSIDGGACRILQPGIVHDDRSFAATTMDELTDATRALALLTASNAVPVIVAQLLRDRWSAPLDFGYVMADGERLFGSHKTWRGLISGMLACIAVATLVDLPIWVGAGFAAASLLADSVSSAIKRRMHLKPGAEYFGLDQLGEALLPLVLFARPLSLAEAEIVGIVIAFVILDVATAKLRHQRWLA
jgi:hypothetical protein